MSFLESVGITASTLEKVKEHNGEALLSDLYLNRFDAIEIIKYFNSIGINVIDELLIYAVDVFFKNIDSVILKIQQYGIPKFVETINNDYIEINNII